MHKDNNKASKEEVKIIINTRNLLVIGNRDNWLVLDENGIWDVVGNALNLVEKFGLATAVESVVSTSCWLDFCRHFFRILAHYTCHHKKNCNQNNVTSGPSLAGHDTCCWQLVSPDNRKLIHVWISPLYCILHSCCEIKFRCDGSEEERKEERWFRQW